MSADAADGLSDAERAAVEHVLFRLADDEFVVAERYTEWQVRAPTLESDLALSNVAQDELGHARLWYDLLQDFGYSEQDLVWERPAEEWRHATLVELPWPEGGWETAVLRGYLYDVAEKLRLDALADSSYGPIADRVGKVREEEDYHREHAANWLERLADDEAGRERLQTALDREFPHALALFAAGTPPATTGADDGASLDARAEELGTRTRTLDELGADWLSEVVPFLESLGLTAPLGAAATVTDADLPAATGRDGAHTDDWGDLYDEFTATYDEVDVGDPARLMDDPGPDGGPS
jgi:ring-1,2-phenylacetyl-CoA epoxidase subunit PaaC